MNKTTSGIPYFHDISWSYDYAGGDRRHVLSLNAVYDLPSASWAPPAVQAILSDWQAAVVAGFQTGIRETVNFTTTDNFDFTGGGDGGAIVVVPDCDPTLEASERTHERWFDTSCFARPAGRGDEGSHPNSHFYGPGSQTWDLTLTKGVRMGAERVVQFRAEFYNLFNQTPWSNLNTTARFNPAGEQINDAFGTALPAASSPRTVQLSLRFAF